MTMDLTNIIVGAFGTLGTVYTGFAKYIHKKTNAEIKQTLDSLTTSCEKLCTELEIIKDTIQMFQKLNEKDKKHKDFILKLNEIIEQTCNFCNDVKITNYIILKGNYIRNFINFLLSTYPEIENIDVKFLKRRIDQLTDYILYEGNDIVSVEFMNYLKPISKLHIENYEMKLIDIIKSNDTDKLEDFKTIVLDFFEGTLSLTIREYNKFIQLN